MALTKEQIKTEYPLPVYNFRVEIDGTTVGFSEVSGLNIAYETITYTESALKGPGPRILYMPGKPKVTTLTMKKGVVTGVSVATLYNWINTIALNRVVKKDIMIRLCDENGAAVVSWKVLNAIPTQLDAPAFTASSNDVAIESMQLCGLDLEEPLQLPTPLSADEQAECEALLVAAIAQAPILRQMSVAGFRGSFGLREGQLSSRDGHWLLQVERQTFDVVIDRFPWSAALVRLPWMPALLQVQW